VSDPRLMLWPHLGSAEEPRTVRLAEFLADYRRSPFASVKVEAIDRVRVLRFLTEPVARGGLGNRRLSPKAMEAVLDALKGQA
jgi:hypothetical protein